MHDGVRAIVPVEDDLGVVLASSVVVADLARGRGAGDALANCAFERGLLPHAEVQSLRGAGDLVHKAGAIAHVRPIQRVEARDIDREVGSPAEHPPSARILFVGSIDVERDHRRQRDRRLRCP